MNRILIELLPILHHYHNTITMTVCCRTSSPYLLLLIIFFTISISQLQSTSAIRDFEDIQIVHTEANPEQPVHILQKITVINGELNEESRLRRDLLGSSPPRCESSRCGGCSPCRTVLVPIHTMQMQPTASEYYPVAWRCQCKGRTYSP